MRPNANVGATDDTLVIQSTPLNRDTPAPANLAQLINRRKPINWCPDEVESTISQYSYIDPILTNLTFIDAKLQHFQFLTCT